MERPTPFPHLPHSRSATKPSPSRRLLAALLLLALAGCEGGGGTPTETPPPEPPAEEEDLTYRVAPPAGKLPWPQHAPRYTQAEYDAMLGGLFIINNFGLYQGGDARESMYLHSGLDVVLPNGTPIRAVESGRVRSITGTEPYYMTVVVEDDDEPGRAWGYTHVNGFQVKAGDPVKQGTWLASVSFQGIEHLHLTRYHLPAGGSWSDVGSLLFVQPDTFFHYHDTEPPVFEGAFQYFPNESDSAFAAGDPPVLSGDVDIVVGLRDPGEHARPSPAFATQDRLAVSRIEYEISGPGGTTRRASFDFRRLALSRRGGSITAYQEASTLFKHYRVLVPSGSPAWWESRTSYYVITNAPPDAPATSVSPATHRTLAWRTAEWDASGKPRFPDGDYVVTVRAWDFRGNGAERSDTVRVRNGGT